MDVCVQVFETKEFSHLVSWGKLFIFPGFYTKQTSMTKICFVLYRITQTLL